MGTFLPFASHSTQCGRSRQSAARYPSPLQLKQQRDLSLGQGQRRCTWPGARHRKQRVGLPLSRTTRKSNMPTWIFLASAAGTPAIAGACTHAVYIPFLAFRIEPIRMSSAQHLSLYTLTASAISRGEMASYIPTIRRSTLLTGRVIFTPSASPIWSLNKAASSSALWDASAPGISIRRSPVAALLGRIFLIPMRVRKFGISVWTRFRTSFTVDAVSGPPGTTVSPTAAVRGRRLLMNALSLPLLPLGGRSGGTAAPAPWGIDAFLPAVFPTAALPGGLPPGAVLVGAGLGRRSVAAAFFLAEGGGSASPPCTCLLHRLLTCPPLGTHRNSQGGVAWPRRGGPCGKPHWPSSSRTRWPRVWVGGPRAPLVHS